MEVEGDVVGYATATSANDLLDKVPTSHREQNMLGSTIPEVVLVRCWRDRSRVEVTKKNGGEDHEGWTYAADRQIL